MKKLLCSFLILLVLLTGCNTQNHTVSTVDQVLTKLESTALFGLMPYLLNKEKKLEYVLFAAGIGLAYGEYVAQKKAQYASEGEKLKIDIDEITSANTKLEKNIKEISGLNSRLEKDIEIAISNYRGAKDQRAKLQKTKEILISIQNILKENIKSTDEILEHYSEIPNSKEDRYPSQTARVRKGIHELSLKKGSLEKQLTIMESHLRSIEKTIQ